MAAKNRKLFTYSQDSMDKALKAIREQGIAVSTACKEFGVPRTSVRNRLSGKTLDNCRQVGPKCHLGEKTEKEIVNWILESANRGFPITKDGLLYSVQKLIAEHKIETPFINNRPGRKWFESFLKRNPQISQKHAEYVSKARALASENGIRRWFQETEELLQENKNILNYPDRVFNMDETSMYLSPKGTLVLGEKGKTLYDVATTSEKENITTLIAVNAEGLIAPPLTIFKFVRIPKTYISAAPDNWGIGRSESGWMQSEQFFEYFANVFHNFLLEKSIRLPVIVYLDGHASHLSFQLSKFCREKQIILVCLPPNTTHILQPLDVAFFFPLKQAWKKIVKEWLYSYGRGIQKKDVPAVINTLLTKKDFTACIINGFRSCGLYPYDANAVNYSKCLLKGEDEPHDSSVKDPDIASHLSFIENFIDNEILLHFENTYLNNLPWHGEETFVELFNVK